MSRQFKMATTSFYLPVILIGLHIIVSPALPQLEIHHQGSRKTASEVPVNVSDSCTSAIDTMFTDPLENETKLARDAFGKPEPGFLVFNRAWLGHYPECKSLIDFKFCMAYIQLEQDTSPIDQPLRWGICVPNVCSEEELVYMLDDIILDLDYQQLSSSNVSRVLCSKDPPRPYDAGFLAVVTLCIVLAVLMLGGSGLQVYLKNKSSTVGREGEQISLLPREGEDKRDLVTECISRSYSGRTQALQRFFLCFALNRNLKVILNTEAAESSILCLNGLRVMSMAWIMLGHAITLIYYIYGVVWDPLSLIPRAFQFGFQSILTFGFPSTDTFFFLSGFLVTYMTVGRMSRSDGKLAWGWFYFHRFLRLFPSLGATILFVLYLKPYMGDGPLSQEVSEGERGCEKLWWTTLLFINNFYQLDDQQCIGWTWYLACDMQLYVISPLILIILYRRPKIGFMVLSLLCLISVGVTIGLVVTYELSVVPQHDMTGPSVMDVVYTKPYCRIPSYLIGIALGYIFYTWKGRKVKINKILVLLGWMVSIATGLAVVYGLSGAYNMNGRILSTAENALYISLTRVAWGAAVAWVVFACYHGYGGWVNDFLSWRAWLPLARVTYGAYLFNQPILMIFAANTAAPFHVNNVYFAIYFVAVFVFGYAVAVVLTLAVEFPILNLEKLVRNRSKF